MACCCGASCECEGKQWVITLAGNVDWRNGNGVKVEVADGLCLNATYVFPFSGGSTLLCNTGIYYGGFTGQPAGLQYGEIQRMLSCSTSACSSSSFIFDLVIGSNATWFFGNPQPANWGIASPGNNFRGWGYSQVRNCQNAIYISDSLPISGGGVAVSGVTFKLRSSGLGHAWLIQASFGTLTIELQ